MVKTKKGNVQEEWRTEHFGMIYASIIEGEVGGGFGCYFCGKQHPNLQALLWVDHLTLTLMVQLDDSGILLVEFWLLL